MYAMVRTFKLEKYHAQRWFEWTQHPSPKPGRWRVLADEHLECSRECLDLRLGPEAPRARRGLLGLRWCFSNSGEFQVTKLPCLDEWQLRRIRWQHDQLSWGDPTDADIAAGRTVAIRVGTAPDTRWLEEDLLELVWDLAGLCHELGALATCAHELSKPRRFERVIRATE